MAVVFPSWIRSDCTFSIKSSMSFALLLLLLDKGELAGGGVDDGTLSR